MTRADGVHSTHCTNTSSIPPQLAEQEAARQSSLQLVRRLRREARDEMEKLIAFLDQSDAYAMTELEDAVDDIRCDEDELDDDERDHDEDGHDHEPSLGSVNSVCQAEWGASTRQQIDLEDEHDGSEPDDCAEPSLGWCENGQVGGGDDGELVDHLRPELANGQRRYRAKLAEQPLGYRLVRLP